jgi:hypothetical protein
MPVQHTPKGANKAQPKTPAASQEAGTGAPPTEEELNAPVNVRQLMECMNSMVDKIDLRLDSKLRNMTNELRQEVSDVRDCLDERLADVQEELDGRIRAATVEVAELKSRVEGCERGMEERLEKMLRDKFKSNECPPALSKSSREERNYWLAWHCLRLCPIDGPDLLQGVRAFIRELDLPDHICDGLNQKSVRKNAVTCDKRYLKEVLVTFQSIEDRDQVKGSAFKLAGKPGSSIRIELPNTLLGSHRILGNTAKKLRETREGCKTSIKLDDSCLDVVLDYRLPNTDVWRKIRPAEAREALPYTNQVNGLETKADEIKKLLEAPPLTGANRVVPGST